MKKTLLAISLLMGLCSAAQAEWVKVFENIRGTFFYMDPATVENHGRLRAVKKEIARIYTVMRERELGITDDEVVA